MPKYTDLAERVYSLLSWEKISWVFTDKTPKDYWDSFESVSLPSPQFEAGSPGGFSSVKREFFFPASFPYKGPWGP